MRPDDSPNACWTSLIGAPMHDLGALPEKCFTCAAKQREDGARMVGIVRQAIDDSLPMWRQFMKEEGLDPEARYEP
jgi:hypothetical protein